MVSQTGTRVVRSNFCKGPNLSWKRAEKEPKGQTKILRPASVIWDQISYIWPQKDQPGTQTPMYSTVNSTSATSYNYDATITFFVIAQQWTSDLSTINISCSAICTQPSYNLLAYLESKCGTVI